MAKKQQPDERLLTIAEVAAWLRVGRRSIERLLASEAFEVVKTGHQVRIRAGSVQRYVELGLKKGHGRRR